MKSLLRVHREVRDVNDDFHSLRTVLRETDDKLKWDFVMFPNDGALSHLPLIGKLIVPKGYPNNPPVLHLFTRTLRSNVDVYRSNIGDETRSTMCFDILRNKTQGGIWEPDYTVSCLFASLMQALVTPRVPQDYGPDRPEFVSMEKLDGVKRHVRETYHAYKDRILHLPAIPTIRAISVPANPFIFSRPGDDTPLESLEFQTEHRYVSQAIYLQNPEEPQCWSTLLDLRNLHPGVVFSVILSNKQGTDPIGKNNDTILLRNGVTGTAAKKLANQPIVWFYHGKPLNDQNLSVCVTVTNDQFTMSYKADDMENFLVHGDTPISRLGHAQIGDVKGIPLFLTVLLKRKSGRPGSINVLDQQKTGFVHANAAVAPQDQNLDLPTAVKLDLGSEQTARLQGIIDFYGLGLDFKIQRGVLAPAHQTLIWSHDLPPEEYAGFVNEHYAPLRGKRIEMNATAIVADGNCVALLTDIPRCCESGLEIPYLSKGHVSHVVMRLRDESIMSEHSGALAERVSEEHDRDWIHVGDTVMQLPQAIKVFCYLKYQF